MSKDSGTTIDYVEIRSSDGSARILRGDEAQKWFEDMVAAFYCGSVLGLTKIDHDWEQINLEEREQECKLKIVK